MKININRSKTFVFSDIADGDIFARARNDELYVKIRHVQGYNCIGLRDGRGYVQPSIEPVRKVKSITVEFEN